MWWADLCVCETELIPLNVLTMRSWASFGSCRTFSKLKILFVAGVNLVVSEDEELVTNALETVANLVPLVDLRIFSSSKPSFIKMTGKRAVQAIMGMLGSSVRTWHCAAADLLGRLILNPDNEPFILPFGPQIYKRLVDMLSLPAVDAQAAAVVALLHLAEVNMDCRLKLASERWAVDRLLKVIKTSHPVPEICRPESSNDTGEPRLRTTEQESTSGL
ncbi:hypothetical protein RHGRI_012226 [Rhododendron griersonianum]|uniref:ARM repeat superfamily protein n=1 Tax=Rhododendron griersonianum TaxID=479676 RepID=A0AAV6KPK8_9ERIC|nr:hypothetical protein RHGRI_012226 [Rhododendron griersonianum]